jgi:hypothetical protein
MTRRRWPRWPWIALAIVLPLALPPGARADGGFVTAPEYWINEPSQRALLAYDDATRTEDLYVHASYAGNTRDFGWIVPTPALPTLDISDGMVLWECAQLTAPVYRERGGWGCLTDDRSRLAEAPAYGGDAGRDDVVVYDEQALGLYRALVVGASNAAALADSLEAWGYLHVGNRSRVLEALQFYIDKSWFFVALRTDPEHSPGDPERDYWSGSIDLIHLRFASPEPVYPMRISALSATEEVEVRIYTFTRHRMTFAGAYTEYANRIGPDELAVIQRDYPRLAGLVGESSYITKLRRTFSRVSMTGDLVLLQAPTDQEFREIHYTGIPSTELLMLALVGMMITRSRRRRDRGAGAS